MEINTELRLPKVFLSYSHDSPDHADRVLGLCDRLRRTGIDAWIDQYVNFPQRGWALWSAQQVEESDCVLVICTEVYARRFRGEGEPREGLGARWEGFVISQTLYESGAYNAKFIPVIFSSSDGSHIPLVLRGSTFYDLSRGEEFWRLYRQLTRQPGAEPPPLGQLVSMPPKQRQTGLYARPAATELRHLGGPPRDLADALEKAEETLEKLTISGKDTQAIREEIRRLHSKIREAGRLRPDDLLCDGQFKLIEVIGEGGFATVWKAYDRHRTKIVAIKVLHDSYAEDRTRIERFFRGAKTMAELDHSRIVKVIEKVLEDGGYHFFVMEHISGGDLRKLVLEKGLSPEHSIRLIGDVGEALSYAHRLGVVHRDVKPGNILIDESGPKLTDFDLVWVFGTTGGTQTGSMLGSFIYSAPEMLSDASSPGKVADVYSLAMTTIFMLFQKDLPYDVLRDPERIISALPCSLQIKAALSKAVSWDPEQRPGSIAEFCYELSGNKPTLAHLVPPSLRFSSVAEVLEPNPGTERIHSLDGSVLVFVPGGKYTQGERGGETQEVARPQHLVTLSPFWISKFLVTNEQYARFLQENSHMKEPIFWDDPRFKQLKQPVVGVSWDEARAYCLWVGMRLPSEAQWEAAARGRECRKYPWGDEPPTPERANFDRHLGHTTPVGSHASGEGPFGTLDQAGNVWEWCEDAWEKRVPFGWESTLNPVFTGRNPLVRCVRGGAWDSLGWALAAASRHRVEATVRSWTVGFRCVLAGPIER